ncbi:hypothetical protein JW921_09990 [Candidatus Fermentibacterales bacterium]|nr:hypothetical protein [Candidatus Fermentibacterales bacterium]
MSTRDLRGLLVGFAVFLAVAAAFEVAMYNWRISLVLEVEQLRERVLELSREWEDLSSQRAELCSPARLRSLGRELGLGPMPLDDLTVISLTPVPSPGGEPPDESEECLAAAR